MIELERGTEVISFKGMTGRCMETMNISFGNQLMNIVESKVRCKPLAITALAEKS